MANWQGRSAFGEAVIRAISGEDRAPPPRAQGWPSLLLERAGVTVDG